MSALWWVRRHSIAKGQREIGEERIDEQPTGEQALRQLDPLVGEWTLAAKSATGEPWPGGGKVTFEWHDSGAHLVQRGTVEHPDVPDNTSIIGCDVANGTDFQLYSDERGVCRVNEMAIGNGEWKLWRVGEPFSQRFIGNFSDDGKNYHRTPGDRRIRHELHG